MANILIVDDSMLERNILSDIVTDLGHNVIGQAKDGEQAVEEYIKLKPDLVTMDLTMGGLGGAAASSQIIAADPEARIVVVSSHQEKNVILDALERGCRHYIIKPLSLEAVSTVINNVLQQSFDKAKHHEVISCLKHAYGEREKAAKRHSARILITDDSAFARQSLRDVVTALGHVVVGEATNATQAFVEYARLKPDLITMDLTMQGAGGAEAISRIMAIHPDARIIVVSATESRASIVDALERGARHYIVKPIRQEKVAEVIENVLQQNSDQKKHWDSLQSQDTVKGLVDVTPECIPPYVISPKDNNFIHLYINQSITFTSFQSLLIELGEYLEDSPNLLLNFGMTSRLDPLLVDMFNKLIQTVKDNTGLVQVISNSQEFMDCIINTQPENASSPLAEILKYSEC
ncbi:MAG: response regulator [Firmicutes bacterium]|nr:response regulator [Bacillota bacterium]